MLYKVHCTCTLYGLYTSWAQEDSGPGVPGSRGGVRESGVISIVTRSRVSLQCVYCKICTSLYYKPCLAVKFHFHFLYNVVRLTPGGIISFQFTPNGLSSLLPVAVTLWISTESRRNYSLENYNR